MEKRQVFSAGAALTGSCCQPPRNQTGGGCLWGAGTEESGTSGKRERTAQGPLKHVKSNLPLDLFHEPGGVSIIRNYVYISVLSRVKATLPGKALRTPALSSPC